MKYTLLEMTQEILSAMDSDEVNSISDTTEAMQVARAVRQAYYDLIEDLNPPEHYTQFELVASGDPGKPTVMYLPADVNSLVSIQYDKIADGETEANISDVSFMSLDRFKRMMYQLSTDETNVGTYTLTTIDASTFPMTYYNDRAPTYYTTFDDYTVLFDAYDSDVDTTLQANKTVCTGKKEVTLSLSDSATPDLDTSFFPRLLNEAKKLAFAELKSQSHEIAEVNARRSRQRGAARKHRIKIESDFAQLPYFGRK